MLSQEVKQELKLWIQNLDLNNGRCILPNLPPNGNMFGCLKAGMGGSLQGVKVRATMVKTRGKTTHKLIGVNGSKTSNFDFHTIISHDQLNSYSNGQYCGSNLFGKNGDTKNRDISVLSKEIWDYLLEKKITITAENLPGKLNIQADQESQSVRDSSEWKLNPSIFRKKLLIEGHTRHGSICISTITPGTSLHVLENKSFQ